MAGPAPVQLSRAQARRFLVGWLGLARPLGSGPGALPALLERLRAVQLDPLDRIGQSAELVALSRLDGLARGQLFPALLPGRAFEHFFKERCLLPASSFPAYRARPIEPRWWRNRERLERLPPGLLDEVLAEVRERGPLAASELRPRGRVEALDWQGWRGTARAERMALEVLWTRCELVVAGRRGRERVYDLPERALPQVANLPPPPSWERWALLERVRAAGLLARSGPAWSGIEELRRSPELERLLASGELVPVRVEGSRREVLAPVDPRGAGLPEPDGRVRILAPLDPLLWDRRLVAAVFDFDYAWEVYKPAERRRWGYYVVPLLQGDRLVGRLEARYLPRHRGPTGRWRRGRLVVERLWPEPGRRLDRRALREALARHQEALRAGEEGA